jgi:cell wall-associated NlpC family hydrolase
MIAATTPESNARPYMNGDDGMLAAFVGRPFAAGANGPDAFDCWGLTRAAALAVFGLDFPACVYAPQDVPHAAPVAAGYLRAHWWHELATASPGAVLALCGYDGGVQHVALCVSSSRVLHISPRGVSAVIPLARIAVAYPVARFYAWAR